MLNFGTETVNFFKRYAYVNEGKNGFDAIVWTKQDEPQATLNNHLHKLAYPDNFKKHIEENKSVLKETHHHHAKEILDLTLRSKYLYTTNDANNFKMFDITNINQKSFPEHIVSAP